MTQRLLDFTLVRQGQVSFAEFVAGLTVDDLRRLTNEMVDTMLGLIAGCVDEDVTFVPEDPDAHDAYAADESAANLAWTLGHVIVHTTATSEETAAIAAELARGVEFHGRSRSEAPWQTVTTTAQCHHRLEESRRMRLASLGMWPDEPYLDNRHKAYNFVGELNAVGYFVLGLFHDDSHLAQITEIVRQAKAAREGS
ncbi:MAG: DinB family protein [Anaerolineae bacterium]